MLYNQLLCPLPPTALIGLFTGFLFCHQPWSCAHNCSAALAPRGSVWNILGIYMTSPTNPKSTVLVLYCAQWCVMHGAFLSVVHIVPHRGLNTMSRGVVHLKKHPCVGWCLVSMFCAKKKDFFGGILVKVFFCLWCSSKSRRQTGLISVTSPLWVTTPMLPIIVYFFGPSPYISGKVLAAQTLLYYLICLIYTEQP